MSNIPATFNAYDEMVTEDKVFFVSLLTSIPSTTYSGFEDHVTIPDAAYSSEYTQGEVLDDDGYSVTLNIDPLEFSGKSFSQDYTVVGMLISLAYDDGFVPLAVQQFEYPVTLGPTTQNLRIGGQLVATGGEADTDINW